MTHIHTIDTTKPPKRQFSGRPKRRHRPIVAKAGAFFIASITGPWKRTISPSKLLTYTDCPAAYLRQEEGDLPVSSQTGVKGTSQARVSAAKVAQAIGNVVHEQIATPHQERTSVEVAVKAAAAAAPSIPKKDVEKAVRTARAMVTVATRADARQARKALHIIREPKPISHFDEESNTLWFVKPDKLQVVETEHGRFVGVDDTKTGRHRHRFANLVPFMFGLVVRRSRAWEQLWNISFNGNVKTSLVYLRSPDGRQLKHPEYVVDTIRAQLTEVQKHRLAGIQGFIRDIDASWQRKHFQVKPGSHCAQCEYLGDCKIGQEFLARLTAHTETVA